MNIGIPKETFPGENRVAIVPATVPSLQKAGFIVHVESGAGLDAGFPDKLYEDQGAVISDRAEVFEKANVLLQIRAVGTNPETDSNDIGALKEGQIVIGLIDAPQPTDGAGVMTGQPKWQM